MIVSKRRVAGFAALILIAVGLAACGASEADQRKAFIAFLQQMNNRAGVHVLKPNAEDKAAFGDYNKHYDVILSFNVDMGEISQRHEQEMAKLSGGGAPRSIEQMAAHRDDIVTVGALIEKIQGEIAKRLAQADAEHTALKQPDDLKAVYDVTYARVVTAPARAIQNSNTVLHQGLQASLQLTDYINTHRDKLTVTGSQILAKDPKTLAEIGVLIKAHQEAGKRFQEAQREGQRLLQGN